MRTGELDIATAPELEMCLENLLSAEGTTLVLDLADLEFTDSTGLTVLVEAVKRKEPRFPGREALVRDTVTRFSVSWTYFQGDVSVSVNVMPLG